MIESKIYVFEKDSRRVHIFNPTSYKKTETCTLTEANNFPHNFQAV